MTSSVATPTCTQPVLLRIKRLTGMGARMQARPRISPVSAIMEPTPFPRARPGFPIHAAITDTNASGIVVPREIMVAPITILGRPVRCASPTTPSTIQSAPFDRSAMQAIITIKMRRAGAPAIRS